jgi:hypothetical protein
MKGPGGRVRYQARREWRCPACGWQRLTSGAVVVLRCDRCQAGSPCRLTWMRLHEEAAASGHAPPATEPEGTETPVTG